MTPQKVLTKQELLSLFENKKDFISDIESHNKALEFIESNDFPDSKIEAWKNSNISKILKHKYILPGENEENKIIEDKFSLLNLKPYKVTFINGKYSQANSDIEFDNSKVFFGSIKEAKKKYPEEFKKYYNTTKGYKDNVFTAINNAYADDGAFAYIPDNISIDKPVHFLFYSNGNDSKRYIQYKNLIILGKNTNVDILTSYHSLSFDNILTNISSEIFLNQDSNLTLDIFQGEGEDTFQLNNTHVIQKKNSNLTVNTAMMCGDFVRNDLIVDLNEEYCNTDLNGFYLPEKVQHFDNYVKVNHNSANCSSNQLYKGIIDNKASASFFGKVYVAFGSQKTNANQSNKNILLTDNAKVYSKPQLEIYADDVSCSHGSTTGQLDKEALFYLRTRGISERNAKTLMLYAFISDVIDKISLTSYKELLYFLLNKRLKGEKIEGLCSIKICPSC